MEGAAFNPGYDDDFSGNDDSALLGLTQLGEMEVLEIMNEMAK